MSERVCHYCQIGPTEVDDLRPYGPGGAYVCYACAMATPERASEAKRLLHAKLDAARGQALFIGGPDGPVGIPESSEGPIYVGEPADLLKITKGGNG